MNNDDMIVHLCEGYSKIHVCGIHVGKRDRRVSDPNERIVPPIIEWWLVGCDVNKDLKVSDMMQLAGIHIQLKDADHVFRLYMKSLGDKAVRRAEESLKLSRSALVDGLRSIRCNTGDRKMD